MSNMSHQTNKEHTFNKMREYMFYEENLCKWTRLIEAKTERSVKSKIKKHVLRKPNIETFKPQQRDKLFWCFYVIFKGMEEYNMAQSNLFSIEKDFKFKTIEIFRKKKSEMKAMKMKIVDIEDNLINGKTINIKTMQALCYVYEKSIIYKHENMFYDFNYGSSYTLIELGEKGLIEMHLKTDDKIIQSIKEKHFCVDIVKPIRGISYYSVTDIHEIASKLAIKNKDDNNKSKTKKALYEEIVQMLEKLR